MRAIFAAVLVAAVMGLQVVELDDDGDSPADDDNFESETTNSAPEKLYITEPGTYTLIAMPPHADPAKSELTVKADFVRLSTEPCEEVLIRRLVMEGTKLGDNLKKIEFTVANDIFNSSEALGLGVVKVTDDGRTANTSRMAIADFSADTGCDLMRPWGYMAAPEKPFRERTRIYSAECLFASDVPDSMMMATVHYSTVWRGVSEGRDVFANDLSFSVSNVKKDSVGWLSKDRTNRHDDVSRAARPCKKPKSISSGAFMQLGRGGQSNNRTTSTLVVG